MAAATISDEGDVTVTLFGAATNTTYAVSFVSNDGTQTTSIGNLKTGADGNGAMRKEAFFKFGTVGAGNIVLTSGARRGIRHGAVGLERRYRVATRFTARPGAMHGRDCAGNSFKLRERLAGKWPCGR